MVSHTNNSVNVGDSWKNWLRMGVPVLIVVFGGFALGWHFLKPEPPGHVVIATGSRQGIYYAIASKYSKYFANNGVTLEVRETGGSAENYSLLSKPDDVDIAIVQGGAAPPAADRPHIQAVASIYLEPVLIFFRGDPRPTLLPQLAGKRIAIGTPGSGVRVLASQLLTEAGVADNSQGTSLLDIGGDSAALALTSGQIDAAFYIISPDAPVVSRLLATPGIHLMSFDDAHAYSRRHPFLSATTLYRGVVDIKQNLPDIDTQLIAAPATIAIRDTTHQAIVQLLVRASQELNSGTTLLSDAGTFPTDNGSDLPFNHDAKYFLKNPPSFLQRALPFWLASIVERLIILVVPMAVVLVPLVRMMPPLLTYRVRRKFFRRYKRVSQIEASLTNTSGLTEIQTGRDELLEMDRALAALRVPPARAEELSALRMHVSFVRTKLDGWLREHAEEAVVPSNELSRH